MVSRGKPQPNLHADPRKKFPINVLATSLKDQTRAAWDAICELNDQDPQLFSVRRRPARIVGGEHDEAVSAELLSTDALGGISAATAYWYKPKKSLPADECPEQYPPLRVIRNMMADPNPPLPPLERIVTAPVFSQTGTVSIEPGYSAESRTYFAKPPALQIRKPKFADITEEEVRGAVDFILGDFLGDFPFVGDADRAHALSLVLNPFVRNMIKGPTPVYLIEAPSPGQGKTLLAEMALYPALGRPVALSSAPGSDDEMSKMLTASFAQLPEEIVIDNVVKDLRHPSFAAALTTTEWTGRILGQSQMVSMPIRATFVVTANNPVLDQDMLRRSARLRLDAKVERPEERRGFRHKDIRRWAAANRGELIDAVLLIVCNWIAQGSPTHDHAFGSYERWASVHGGILHAAGIPGFLQRNKDDEQFLAPREAAFFEFVEKWFAKWGEMEVSTAVLFPIAQEVQGFDLGRSSGEHGQKTVFGITLAANRDRIYGGKRVSIAGKYQGALQYRLEVVSEQPTLFEAEKAADDPF